MSSRIGCPCGLAAGRSGFGGPVAGTGGGSCTCGGFVGRLTSPFLILIPSLTDIIKLNVAHFKPTLILMDLGKKIE